MALARRGEAPLVPGTNLFNLHIIVFAGTQSRLRFVIFDSRGPQKRQLQKFRTHIRTRVPIPFTLGGIGFGVLGLQPNDNLDGHGDPNCLGRMDTTQEQQTCRICVTYVGAVYIAATRRPARVADGWRHTKLLSEQRHGPCGKTMPTRGRREGRKSHEVESWRGADATSMTPPRAVPTTAVCRRGYSGCCFFRTRLYSLPPARNVVALLPLGQHTHGTQHAPRTRCTTRRGGVE